MCAESQSDQPRWRWSHLQAESLSSTLDSWSSLEASLQGEAPLKPPSEVLLRNTKLQYHSVLQSTTPVLLRKTSRQIDAKRPWHGGVAI